VLSFKADKQFRWVASLSLTLASAIVIFTVAAPVKAEDPIVKLVSTTSGKCLQPINQSHNRGDAIVQKVCNGSAAQQWTVHIVSATKVHLINRDSGLCMDARGKGVDGTPIQQWPCNQISNEDWGFGITNNTLSSAVSDSPWTHCIATPGTQDGLPMELRQCDGDPSQVWSRPNG